MNAENIHVSAIRSIQPGRSLSETVDLGSEKVDQALKSGHPMAALTAWAIAKTVFEVALDTLPKIENPDTEIVDPT